MKFTHTKSDHPLSNVNKNANDGLIRGRDHLLLPHNLLIEIFENLFNDFNTFDNDGWYLLN